MRRGDGGDYDDSIGRLDLGFFLKYVRRKS
jgi:hypothetical protein